MKKYLGIDLGGTNVRVGVVTEDGTVLQQVKSVSYAQDGVTKVLDNLKQMVYGIEDYKSCSGIGIGLPGPCDTVHGKMVLSTNLPGFAGYPMVEELQ